MSKYISPFNPDELDKIIDNASKQQLAWLSGYLWGLANNDTLALETPQQHLSPIVSKTIDPANNQTITILSASQTGNARRIAQQLNHELNSLGLSATHVHAADYKFKKIDQENILIIITSTQGEGEPPEEAFTFYKWLSGKKVPALNNLHYAVLGLGDTSYTHFCQAGKYFDQRLAELGATRLLERVDADTDYQAISHQWLKSVVDKLKNNLTQSVSHQHNMSTASITPNYSRNQPFLAAININQKITGRRSDRDIRHIEVDLTGSGITYQAGDALGIWFENDSELVDELLATTQLAPDTQVDVDGELLPLQQALLSRRELTQNTPFIVEKYANLINDRHLLTLIQDKLALRDFCQATPLIDMLNRYQGNLSAQAFINILRPLNPRFYSIASAQDEVGDEAHLTVNIVQYWVDGKQRTGGASGFLARQTAESSQVNIFIESNDNFRLPDDNAIPIIMIAAGTGIAPFRAFIQQRASESASGKNWLFFGNPHFTEDFLYQLEWQNYLKEEQLSRIDLAWSRDQADKIYVQDKLIAQSHDLWLWLQEGAYIYVCGDANHMANAVHLALLNIIMQQGNYDEEQANEYLDELRSNKRYQRDIY